MDNVHDNINNECISFIPKSQSLGFMSILRTPAICGFVFEPFECSSSRESLRKIVLKRNTRIPNTKRLSQPPTITIPGFAWDAWKKRTTIPLIVVKFIYHGRREKKTLTNPSISFYFPQIFQPTEIRENNDFNKQIPSLKLNSSPLKIDPPGNPEILIEQHHFEVLFLLHSLKLT